MRRAGFQPVIRALILAALIGAAAALWTWTLPGASETGAPSDAVVVQVLDNGFHTDLAVPRAALMRRGGPLAQAVARLGPGDWILIGWGDARFYVDQSPIVDRLPDGARAFFRPGNASVVMLDPAAVDPRLTHGEDSASLTLTQGRFDRLAARVEQSLALSHGAARVAASRPGDDAPLLRQPRKLFDRPPVQPLDSGGAERRGRAGSAGSIDHLGRGDAVRSGVGAGREAGAKTGHAPGAGLDRPTFAYPAGSDPLRANTKERPMAHKQHTRNSSGPAGPSQRQLRAGELIRHALVDILREEEIHDEALVGVSVTVTEVRLSPDLKHATCFVEPLGAGVETAPTNGHESEIIKALNAHAKFLRGQLGRRLDMKFTPDLRFRHDESFDAATHMDRLFDDPRVRADLGRRDEDEGDQ